MNHYFKEMIVLFVLLYINPVYAQSEYSDNKLSDTEIAKDIVGVWVEQFAKSNYSAIRFSNTWVFNVDGTVTTKSVAKGLKERLVGYPVYMDVNQDYTPSKWQIDSNMIVFTNIPLRHLNLKVSNPDLSEFNTREQQQIRAAIPDFERKSTRALQLDWEKGVGRKARYLIRYYSKNRMIVRDLDNINKTIVFIRNVKGYLDSKITKKTGTLNGHDYVDLGLPSGTLWATCNVGAADYIKNGSHFAFGETMTKQNYSEGTYKFYFKQNGQYNLKKYCSSLKYTTSYDYVDGKDKLDLGDDVAHVKWGGDWHLPTKENLEELMNECKWEPLNDGVILTGPNGNSIFLPAAGWMTGVERRENDGIGYYLSQNATESAGAWILDIKEKKMMAGEPYIGNSVRPVNTSKVAETKQRMLEETRKAEEAKKAEEARKAEEAKKVEEIRKAKEEAEKARKAEQFFRENQDYLRNLSIEKQKSAVNAYIMGVELVDLGLSVRWANMNIGANRPEDKGDFFSWGEVEPTPGREDTDYKPLVPYDAEFLDEHSDPATVKLGVGFHTPTVKQWKELKKKCKRRLSDDRKCVIFIGPNGNSITFPFYTYWSNQRAKSWYIMDYGTDDMTSIYNACLPIRPVLE